MLHPFAWGIKACMFCSTASNSLFMPRNVCLAGSNIVYTLLYTAYIVTYLCYFAPQINLICQF